MGSRALGPKKDKSAAKISTLPKDFEKQPFAQLFRLAIFKAILWDVSMKTAMSIM